MKSLPTSRRCGRFWKLKRTGENSFTYLKQYFMNNRRSGPDIVLLMNDACVCHPLAQIVLNLKLAKRTFSSERFLRFRKFKHIKFCDK